MSTKWSEINEITNTLRCERATKDTTPSSVLIFWLPLNQITTVDAQPSSQDRLAAGMTEVVATCLRRQKSGLRSGPATIRLSGIGNEIHTESALSGTGGRA